MIKLTDFHETNSGRKFFDHQLPDLINAVGRLAAAQEKLAEMLELRDKSPEDVICEFRCPLCGKVVVYDLPELLEKRGNPKCFCSGDLAPKDMEYQGMRWKE